MEYLEGDTLAARLPKGPAAARSRASMRYRSGLCAGSPLIVTGLSTGNAKRANIMLTSAGAKLMDFGVPKRRSSGPSEPHLADAAGHHRGNRPIHSPEQVEGREANPRSDIFSFGAVVYEMVRAAQRSRAAVRRAPWGQCSEREPPQMTTLQQLTPPILDHIVRRCLAEQPEDRWQSAGDSCAN